MKENVINLYLVRHGQTDWNKIKKMQGSTDIPLNNEGREQALLLKEHFEAISFDAAYSSDLSRAKETAEIISSGRQLQVTAKSELRERYWGQHEGSTVEGLKSKYGTHFEPLVEVFEPFKDSLHPDLHEVESYSDAIVGRVFPFLEEIKNKFLGKTVLAVSHGGILKGMLLFLNLEEYSKPYVDNVGYLHLQLTPDIIILKGSKGIKNHSPIV